MQQLETPRIISTLARLKTVGSVVFGADDHGFRVNPRLPEADILAFEQEHKIALPVDYRQFLINVGNGGAGPFYGVFPLGQMDHDMGFQQWSENDGVIGSLSAPFLLEESWNDLSSMPNSDIENENGAEYDAQMESFEKKYWSATLVNGAIPICHEGCALRIWLVVTGNQAGYLWEDRRTEYDGLHPVKLTDDSPATFTGWYQQWLDECLATADRTQTSKT